MKLRQLAAGTVLLAAAASQLFPWNYSVRRNPEYYLLNPLIAQARNVPSEFRGYRKTPVWQVQSPKLLSIELQAAELSGWVLLAGAVYLLGGALPEKKARGDEPGAV